MSRQQNALRTLAARINSRALEDVESFFTADFLLHDPSARNWPHGHEGAQKIATAILDLGDDVRLEALDMIENGDRVAVRWSVQWLRDGARHDAAMIAIYRFENGLIAEDWGVAARQKWP